VVVPQGSAVVLVTTGGVGVIHGQEGDKLLALSSRPRQSQQPVQPTTHHHQEEGGDGEDGWLILFRREGARMIEQSLFLFDLRP
jgi:hypothetical protein